MGDRLATPIYMNYCDCGLFLKQQLHNLASRLRHIGTRTEDSGNASAVEEVVVL